MAGQVAGGVVRPRFGRRHRVRCGVGQRPALVVERECGLVANWVDDLDRVEVPVVAVGGLVSERVVGGQQGVSAVYVGPDPAVWGGDMV